MAATCITSKLTSLTINDLPHNDRVELACIRQHSSALLSLPVKVREKIYHHIPDDRRMFGSLCGLRHGLDFKLLAVCRQMRSELWAHFAGNQSWIRVNLTARHGKTPSHTLTTLVNECLPREILSGDIDTDLANRSVVRIELETNASSTCKVRKTKKKAYCGYYSASAWSHFGSFCENVRASATMFSNMTITLQSQHASNQNVILRDILLPLAHIRGLSKVQIYGCTNAKLVRHLTTRMQQADLDNASFADHFLALKEEATKHINFGDWVAANVFLTTAIPVYGTFAQCIIDLKWDYDAPEIVGTMSLFTDIQILGLKNQYKALDKSTNDNTLPPTTILTVFDHLVQCSLDSATVFFWPGMSDEQRAEAYYFQGSVFRRLREYIVANPGLRKVVEDYPFKVFTKSGFDPNDPSWSAVGFWNAWQAAKDTSIGRAARLAYRAVRREMNDGIPDLEHPPVTERKISCQKKPWRGTPLLLLRWGPDGAAIPSLGAANHDFDLQVTSMKKLKALDSEVGAGRMNGSRGLLRLLV